MTDLGTASSREADLGRPRQPKNGTNNKLLAEDRPAHDWYRFVLSFPPHLVRDYVGRFGLTARHRVLDPFCGTGTTLVECKKLGIPSVGVEANPMARFASDVKTRWEVSPDGLLEDARRVAGAATQALEEAGTPDNEPLPLFDPSRAPARGVLRSLPTDAAGLLLKDSISPVQLHKTLILLDCLRAQPNERYRDHELLALAKALVAEIGNLHFGPEVGVRIKKHNAPVIASWLACVGEMADDLRSLRDMEGAAAEAHGGDARDIEDVLGPASVDAVITSPPYPNEKDYSRTTRLESVLFGFIRSKQDLRAFKKTLLRSNTRNVYKGDDDDAWIVDFPEIHQLAQEIETRRIKLGKTSGFERQYKRVTTLYFGGMARHLAGLRRVLRPGARLAYVVGDQASYLQVMIRTGQLLARVAESLGYEVEGIDLFRERLATATREWLREEILVLRWPGTS